MKRPDEEKFQQHAQHFLVLDPELESFCAQHGFTLDKNLHRTPCRVLRRRGNPELIFDIYQQGNWLEMEYMEGLPHTFAVAAYYQAAPDDLHLYKLEFAICENESFREVVSHLSEYLNEGLRLLNSWTPEVFISDGTRIENLKKIFAQ